MPVTIRKKRYLDRNVYDLAVERTERVFKMFDHVSVSFSGGKDSMAILNVTLEVARRLGRLPLEVVFLDEECIPYQTEQYARRVAQISDLKFLWLCLPVKHRNSCSPEEPYWYPWDPNYPEKWVRPMPPEAITTWPGFVKGISWPDAPPVLYRDTPGSVGMILGVRAQESLARQRYIGQARKTLYWVTPFAPTGVEDGKVPRRLYQHVWKAYTIYDWTTEDLWVAARRFGWDYNEAYDIMEMVGIPPHHQRCAIPFGDEPIQRLHTFKTCFPEIWEKLSRRVPGAATAALYATTGLYGFKERIELPAGLTWPAYVRAMIEKRPDVKAQKVLALRIRKNIRTHYKKTSDPILDVEHPVTGLSWPFLAQVALRGDLYQRKIPHLGLWGEDPKRDEAYKAALERWRQDPTPFQVEVE